MSKNKILSIICLCISSISILLSTITLIDLNVNKTKARYLDGKTEHALIYDKKYREMRYDTFIYETWICENNLYFEITNQVNAFKYSKKNYYYEIKLY